MQTPRVLLITDAAYANEVVLGVILAAGKALPVGAFAVQLRDKRRSIAERAAWAERLRGATREVEAALIVNGDVELARAVQAEGVHFGGGTTAADVASAEGLWRSAAAHSADEAVLAVERGVDAILVSPIFSTPGKAEARGVGALREAASLVRGKCAVIALGGVDAGNARPCRDAGADGVAVIRALLASREPAEIARALIATDGTPRSPRYSRPDVSSTLARPMATSYDETLRITTEILATHVDMGRDIKATDHIQHDLGLDSLGVMEVVADIEDRFEVNIPTETLSNMSTVGDVAQALVKLKQ